MTTLAQLLIPQTQQQLFDLLIAQAQAAGYPVTAWQPGGVERTRYMTISKAMLDVASNYVPAIAGGSLLDYAPNFPGWTELTAEQIYDLSENLATFTAGTLVATNTATIAYPFTAGSLKFTFSLSNRSYFSSGSGSIPASGSLTIPVIAENAGAAYLEPNSSPGILLTSTLPGVTVTNPASNYAAVLHVGSGTGGITPVGTPIGPHSVKIDILTTGTQTTCTWQYSIDGNAPVFVGSSSDFTIAGTGIEIVLAAGSVVPSFVANDSYSFTCPGSWITSQGGDLETATALAARCRSRWSTLSLVPTENYYSILAKSVPSVGSQVTDVTVVPDAVINNKVNIIVTGPGIILPSTTISLIQTDISNKARGCDFPVVSSPVTIAIIIGLVLTADSQRANSVLALVQSTLLDYIANIPTNGTIRLSAIIDRGMNVQGAVDIDTVTINGVAANLVLGGVGSFVRPAFPPTFSITLKTQ